MIRERWNNLVRALGGERPVERALPASSLRPSMADQWDKLPLTLKAEFFYALAPVIEKRANAGLPPPSAAGFSLTFADGSVWNVGAPLRSNFEGNVSGTSIKGL